MLQTQAVEPKLLELLRFLMSQPSFDNFYLVGGTALALQLGHRKSIDIDLFGNAEIKEDEFTDILTDYGTIQILKKSKNILVLSVDGIKLDFVHYKYDWIENFNIIDDIRLASKPDIMAMKLNAIAGRGSKKDFIDLYYLLKEFTLEEGLQYYTEKYKDGSEFLVRKSLLYFKDADAEPSPFLLEELSWSEVKTFIKNAVCNIE